MLISEPQSRETMEDTTFLWLPTYHKLWAVLTTTLLLSLLAPIWNPAFTQSEIVLSISLVIYEPSD